MALTATSSVRQEIINFFRNPVQSVASVNQNNIFYSCYQLELLSNGEDRYTQMCKQISHVISSKDQRAIIYVDFVKDAAPLAISLRQAGYSTCSYHGQKLSSHDKLQSIEAWRNGSVKVMVCTTAFGMGTDQPDVEIVIRIRCLPTLESMVQEFGRAERDGRLAKGVLLYQESDFYHATFWSKSDKGVLHSFSQSWRYVISMCCALITIVYNSTV
ncbi:ATP-dependent DNA helicase Q1-like [Dysidea avara]|uniref:ATP-dependent DNA helicase Q1-like n=1 Tax=Dysidea avara TaxID=196820 RepID=UPI00332DB279